jgi:hypothetical protein
MPTVCTAYHVFPICHSLYVACCYVACRYVEVLIEATTGSV